MAQLSSNTIFYDQIIKKIQDFILKYKNNNISSYQQMAKEYSQIITEVNKYPISQISKFDPVIKGEPPSSAKMNKFVNSINDDLSIFGKQLEYQTAMVVSIYNMFTSEIEKESTFLDRIKSKAKILNTYSQSPADELFYYGDTFDNMDKIDIPNSRNLPNARNLPKVDSRIFNSPVGGKQSLDY